MNGWFGIFGASLLLTKACWGAIPTERAEPPSVNAAPPVHRIVEVPKASEKSLRFYRQSNLVWSLRAVGGILFPAVLLFTGFSTRLRTLAHRLGHWWYPGIIIYFAVLLL